jgi:hypothetical protein
VPLASRRAYTLRLATERHSHMPFVMGVVESNITAPKPFPAISGVLFKVFAGVALLLVVLRVVSEWAMMAAHGSDPQMPIWIMLFAVKIGFWFATGSALIALVYIWRQNASARLALGACLLVWAIAVSVSSWLYLSAGLALMEAANPRTSPARLSQLVHYFGIQAGYELDNRIAANPSTPKESLRELYWRGNTGTLMKLAANPRTPDDILEQLAQSNDEWIRKSLAANTNAPALEEARQPSGTERR